MVAIILSSLSVGSYENLIRSIFDDSIVTIGILKSKKGQSLGWVWRAKPLHIQRFLCACT
jgi:hypothetical protein